MGGGEEELGRSSSGSSASSGGRTTALVTKVNSSWALFAIDFDERLDLSVSLLGSQAAVAGGAQGAACEAVGAPPEGRAARLHLLRCHVVRESDIEEVRELGRAAARAATSLESDSDDYDKGHFAG